MTACSTDSTAIPLHPYPVLTNVDPNNALACAIGAATTGYAIYRGYQEFEGNTDPDFWSLYLWTLEATAGGVTTGWACAAWFNDYFNDWVYYSCNRQVEGFNPRYDPTRGAQEQVGDFVNRFFQTAQCFEDGTAHIIDVYKAN